MGVPPEAGAGKATVKVSFPGLKTPQVAPTGGEVLIQNAPPPAAPQPPPADDGMGGR